METEVVVSSIAAQVRALNEQAFTFMHTDLVQMEALAKQALELSIPHNYIPGIIGACRNLGIVAGVQGQVKTALEYFHQGADLCKISHDRDEMIRSYLNIGYVHHQSGHYGSALRWYHKAIDIIEAQADTDNENAPDTSLQIMCYCYTGNLYAVNGFFELAQPLLHRAELLLPQADNPAVELIIRQSWGEYYKQAARWPTARRYLEEALTIGKTEKYYYWCVSTLSELGDVAASTGDISAALDFYRQAQQLAAQIRRHITEIEQEIKIADLLAKMVPQQSIPVAESGLKKAQNLDVITLVARAHSVLAEALERLGLHAEALHHYRQFTTLEKELGKDFHRQSLVEIITQMEKVRRHSRELAKQKKEIEQKNQKLLRLTGRIAAQHEALESQHQSLTDSIYYAQRIQAAMLPFKERIEKALPKHFIFLAPLNIVSGDFYWFETFDDASDLPGTSGVVLACGDCTGHGVPGAMMSMLGIVLLSEIIQAKRCYRPDLILAHLDTYIRYALHQHENDSRDGMDIQLVVLTTDPATGCFDRLLFAGANNPILHVQDGQAHLLSADRRSVGGIQSNKTGAFNLQTLSLLPGDRIYLFTDGFQDQFGGTYRRKFMAKPFQQLLTDISSLPMTEAKEKLVYTFDSWKQAGNCRQIDDVLVIGIEI
jgi:serine phosphatase RsbU (regulator of sigma subunit)